MKARYFIALTLLLSSGAVLANNVGEFISTNSGKDGKGMLIIVAPKGDPVYANKHTLKQLEKTLNVLYVDLTAPGKKPFVELYDEFGNQKGFYVDSFKSAGEFEKHISVEATSAF